MIPLARRLRIAWWALVNAERLHALQFEMMRDAETLRARARACYRLYARRETLTPYEEGRVDAAELYGRRFDDLPGTADNRSAL